MYFPEEPADGGRALPNHNTMKNKAHRAALLHLVSVLLVLFLLPLQPADFCQVAAQTKITVSKKKKTIDGKTYYLHTVKKGENLFAIANAYGVLQKDIVAANPNAFTGIRIGEELKIPAGGGSTSYEGQGLESEQFIYHIARVGQKKEEIAAQYNLPLDTLYKFNPELQYAPIDAGQVVIIPKAGAAVPEEHAAQDGFVLHQVESMETLFSIGRKYGVSTNEILDANPDIDRRTELIRVGQTIRIPSGDAQPIALPLVFRQTDTIVVRQDTIGGILPAGQFLKQNGTFSINGPDMFNRKQLRVALLLPLFVDENTFPDTTQPETDEASFATDADTTSQPETPPLYSRSLNFLEFYQGVLTALHDLRAHGFQIALHTYDTGREVQKLDEILQEPDLSQADLIIGPFYSEMLSRINRFAQENQIGFVSPLTENTTLLNGNPYMLQFFPTAGMAHSLMLQYLESQGDAHIIFIRNSSEVMPSDDLAFMQQVRQRIPAGQFTSIDMQADQKDVFGEGFFNEENRYVIVTTSTEELFAANLMAQLNVASQHCDIRLCGPEKWTQYVNIDLDYFHQLNFHYCAPFFIDRSQPETQAFLQRYQTLFQTEPYEILSKGYNYAFLGYDICTYFVQMIQKYGKEFAQHLDTENARLLQSDVAFVRRNGSSGMENHACRLVQYTRDFTLEQDFIGAAGTEE